MSWTGASTPPPTRRELDWGYMSCILVSFLLGILALMHLVRLPDRARQRLFWKQLVWTIGVDLIFCVLCIFFLTGCAFGTFCQDFDCRLFNACRGAVEMMSSFLEVQIAIGMACSCGGSLRLARWLAWWPPLSIPFGILVAWPLAMPFGRATTTTAMPLATTTTTPMPQCLYVFVAGLHTWPITILVCCSLAIVFYVFAIFSSFKLGSEIRHRVQAQGTCYLLSFCATFGPRAFFELLGNKGESGDTVDRVTKYLVALKGALNVCTYAFWSLRRSALERRSACQDVSLSVLEQLQMDKFFDFNADEDESIFARRRAVAEAVSAVNLMR